MSFRLEFQRKADKEAKNSIRQNLELAGKFREYLEKLSSAPYWFPKKKGKLKSCRALSFNVKDTAGRLIFRINDAEETVEILAIGVRDDAYNLAERRV